jgi:eukaryotic-like serine/threonine-protein kinase
MTVRHFVLSPEQIHAAPRSEKTDVFFFGVMLFQLITGREPYPTKDEFAYLQAFAAGQRTPLSAARPEVPAALASVVDACLEHNPVARPDLTTLEQRLRALSPPAPAPRPWWKVWARQ